MKILRNYILKDFFSAFISSFLFLTLVMLLGNLMKISDMVIRKGVPLLDALKIFSFFIPYLLRFTIPLSFLLGILLCIGRIVADHEIIAINVAGISIFQIMKIFLILGVIFSLFLFVLNDSVIADFHYHYRNQIKNIYSKNIAALIEPGIFLEGFSNHILYVSDKKDNKLKSVFIYEVGGERGSLVTFAKNAEFVVDNSILKLKLMEGFRDETDPNNPGQLYRLNFKVFFIDLPMEEKQEEKIEKKPSEMRLRELRQEIRRFKKMEIETGELEGEFHERISFSSSIIPFIILGFGVAVAVKHRERSINFGIAFVIAGFYYLLLILGEALLEYKLVIPSLAMWFPNVAITAIGSYLIYKHAHTR